MDSEKFKRTVKSVPAEDILAAVEVVEYRNNIW